MVMSYKDCKYDYSNVQEVEHNGLYLKPKETFKFPSNPMYIFLLTKAGEHTQAKVTEMVVYDIEGLLSEFTFECYKFKEPTIRVGKLNDIEFGVKKTKDLSLQEFEEIFGDYLEHETVKRMLMHNPESLWEKYPYFRKDIYKKYGIIKKDE
jgi:hypothetical protein